MTVRCGGREFKVHSAIVCTQSSFFQKAFSDGLKEGSTLVIDLPHDDPVILDRFLEFLYTGTYRDEIGCFGNAPSTASMMNSEEIRKSLGRHPGVICEDNTSEIAESETTETTVGDDEGIEAEDGEEEEEEDEHGDEYCDEDPDDTGYRPPYKDRKEPKDEYDEFGGEYDEFDEFNDEFTSQLRSHPFETWCLFKSGRELDEEQSSAVQTVAKERNDLLLSLRLYGMADKYGVPALKLLARDRFYRAAELAWEDTKCFPEVVDELFCHPPETDMTLRDIVCRLVGSRLHDSQVRDKIWPLMRQHRDFAFGVMEYMTYFSGTSW
ncbi:hypothetical protein EDB81DRAFT_877233 [Dactylonectria macrodidyma]|uniref:BTB domain-containing protein n=1 Tax=Dactylonectria macrodidyma TaxID=307937 RepID=A0A9P9FRX2_9HYPO|nr:hypothetical protein EDB81DRAFT_877233 [Dactylonectria macrodidyma]